MAQRVSPIRVRLVLALLLVLAGIVVWTVRVELQLTPLVLALAGALAASGLAILLLSYLRGEITIGAIDSMVAPEDRAASADVEFLSSMLSRVTAALTKVQQDLAEMKAARVSSPMQVDADSIRAAVREDVVNDVADRLDARYARSAIEAAHVTQIRRNFDETFLRLRSELAALARRGNLNLVIGTLTTAAAVGLLLYMLVPRTTLSTWTALLAHYVPRLTTVIFIEVFAFFFLRLYRNGLAQIQYYHNELTSLSLNWSAFELGVTSGEKPMLLVEQFARADRNRQSPDLSDATAPPDIAGAAEAIKKVAEVLAAVAKK